MLSSLLTWHRQESWRNRQTNAEAPCCTRNSAVHLPTKWLVDHHRIEEIKRHTCVGDPSTREVICTTSSDGVKPNPVPLIQLGQQNTVFRYNEFVAFDLITEGQVGLFSIIKCRDGIVKEPFIRPAFGIERCFRDGSQILQENITPPRWNLPVF